MDTTKNYLVTCGVCGGERKVKIHTSPLGAQIDWLEDDQSHKIISFRERLDGEWGFQCLCGNNDLMTDQESKTFRNPAEPKPQEIKEIVSNLVVQKPNFNVVEV